MRVPLALAFLLLAGALAGCSSLGSDGPTVATARDWQSVADHAAHKWAEDAVLMSASASELDDAARAELDGQMDEAREEIDEMRKDGDIPEDAEAEIKASFDLAQIVIDTPDPKVGDGKSTLWGYVYAAASRPDELDFVAVAHGDVVYHDDDDGFVDEFDVDVGRPLGNWSVDSSEAAAAASLGSEDFVAVCGLTNLLVNFHLTEGEGATLWSVWAAAGEAEGDLDEASVAIDAATGSIIKDQAIEDVIQVLQQEAGEEGGSFFLGVDTTQGTGFKVVQQGHAQLAFEIQMFPAPVQPVTVTITDPNGTVTQLTLQQGQSPNRAETQALLDMVPIGTYDIEIRDPIATLDQWQFSWCTDGTPLDEDEGGDAPACALLDQSGGSEANPRGETLSRLHRWVAPWES